MLRVLLLATSAYGLSTSTSVFGPKHCVSVYKNQKTGTCVIQTNCDSSVNLDTVEFAFTCQLPNMLQKHSFGKGGFDLVEEFDTSVKCDECGIPQEVTMSLENASQKESASASKQEESMVNVMKKSGMGKKDAVTFGPNGCISTWLKPDTEKNEDGEHGTCQVETKCSAVEDAVFTEYPMGLVCVDKDQMPTRHLFGSNSFDKNEKFDTLIRCSTCLGLDKVSESITLEATVKSLAKEVYEIKDEVYKLEKQADGTLAMKKSEGEKPAPAAAAPAPAAAAPAAAEFAYKKSLRGSKSEESSEDSTESEDSSEDSDEDSD